MLAKKRKKIEKSAKNARQMERHLKGMANHYRIEILFIVAEHPKITLDGIVGLAKANPKTIGEHARRLYQAGLIRKSRSGNCVQHDLSPYGKLFVKFLNSFKNS